MKTINLLIRVSANVAEDVDTKHLYVDLTGMKILQPDAGTLKDMVVPYSLLEYETMDSSQNEL